jgi:hypothetical protein
MWCDTYEKSVHVALPTTFTLPNANGDGRVRQMWVGLFSNRVQDPVRSGLLQRRIGGAPFSILVQSRESVPGLLKMGTWAAGMEIECVKVERGKCMRNPVVGSGRRANRGVQKRNKLVVDIIGACCSGRGGLSVDLGCEVETSFRSRCVQCFMYRFLSKWRSMRQKYV